MADQLDDKNPDKNSPEKTSPVNLSQGKLDTILEKIASLREEIHKNRKLYGLLAIPLLVIFLIASYNDIKIFFSGFSTPEPIYISDTYLSFNSKATGRRTPESHLYLGLYNTVNQSQPRGKVWLFGQTIEGSPYKILNDRLDTVANVRATKYESSPNRSMADIPQYLLACMEGKGKKGHYRPVQLVVDEKKTRIWDQNSTQTEIQKAQINYTFPEENSLPAIALYTESNCEALIAESADKEGQLFSP